MSTAKSLNATQLSSSQAKSTAPAEDSDPTTPSPLIQDPQVAIVASTFANLELQSCKQTLAQMTELYERARGENARLSEELRERDKDALQVVEFLRHEIEGKQTLLREAEQKLSALASELQTKHDAEIQMWKDRTAEKDKTIKSVREECQKLRKEIEAVALYRREKQELFLEVSKHKELQAQTVNRYEKELTKLRFQALEDKVHLRAAEKEMTDHFNEEVDARAMLLVDAKAKDIHKENQQLRKDNKELAEEMARLSHQNQELRLKHQMVQREADLGQALQKEYASQGCTLSLAAKDATSKAKQLELKNSELIASYERRIAEVQTQADRTAQDLSEKLQASLKSEKFLQHELLKLRKLSSRIVAGRSDLEEFFYEVLEHVREQQQLLQSHRNTLPDRDGTIPVPYSSAPSSARSASSKRSGMPLPFSISSSVKKPTTAISKDGVPLTTTTTPRDRRILDSANNRVHYEQTHRFFLTSLPAGATRGEQQQPQQDPPPLAITGSRAGSATNGQRGTDAVPPSTDRAESNEENLGADRPPHDGPDFSSTPSIPPLAMGGLSAPNTQGRPGKGFSRRFEDLSWADKEMIIRALLHKINSNFYSSDPKLRSAEEGDFESVAQGTAGPSDREGDLVETQLEFNSRPSSGGQDFWAHRGGSRGWSGASSRPATRGQGVPVVDAFPSSASARKPSADGKRQGEEKVGDLPSARPLYPLPPAPQSGRRAGAPKAVRLSALVQPITSASMGQSSDPTIE
jgi:hypothetical protein